MLCSIGGVTVAAGSQEPSPLVRLDTSPGAAALLVLPSSTMDGRRAGRLVAPDVALVIGSRCGGADDDSNEMIVPAIESAAG